MARDHSQASRGRKGKGSIIPKKILLFVEGRNTEPSYFELLKRSNCKLIPVVKPGSGIGSCVGFVEEADKKFGSLPKAIKEKYSQRWVVFDYDGHPDFEDGIRKARKLGFKVAFSSMCIEYWFLLHFISHDGSPIPMKGDSHSKAQIDLINKAIGEYNKSAKAKVKDYEADSKKVEEDFFDLMMAVNPTTNNRRIVDACRRAEAIHTAKKGDGAEFKESVTTMYELIREIGVVD